MSTVEGLEVKWLEIVEIKLPNEKLNTPAKVLAQEVTVVRLGGVPKTGIEFSKPFGERVTVDTSNLVDDPLKMPIGYIGLFFLHDDQWSLLQGPCI